ncbi:MAG: DEAD/DEAH box helicase [Gammaproteobacteria bacterium]
MHELEDPIMQNDFSSLGVSDSFISILKKQEINLPTPIQAKSIPEALQGRDILGIAPTGTGKTLGFLIPIMSYLLSSSREHCLILVPTRELGMQIIAEFEKINQFDKRINSVLIIGGEPQSRQVKQLAKNPQIVIGTPGRLNDLLGQGKLLLHNFNRLILDETDRMLDMGFSIQIEKIIKFLPEKRQTLLFSATFPDQIKKIANSFLSQPFIVKLNHENHLSKDISQELRRIETGEKFDILDHELQQRDGTILIFVKTKRGAEKITSRLRKGKHSVDTIHGDLRQNKRDKVISRYRGMKFRILVATDVASRGLDIPHIDHVINYDLPQCPEDFVHRIGRTARAGAKGKALTFITSEDNYLWGKINKIVKIEKIEKIDKVRKTKGKVKPNKKTPSWLKKRELKRKKRSTA